MFFNSPSQSKETPITYGFKQSKTSKKQWKQKSTIALKYQNIQLRMIINSHQLIKIQSVWYDLLIILSHQMQKEEFRNEFSLAEIEALVGKIINQAASIPGFKYADLLKQKSQQFMTDFNKKTSESISEHMNESHKLRLIFKSDPKPQIQKGQSQKKSVKVILEPPNIFLYTFELPCSYKAYENMIRIESIQKELDQIISSYKILEQVGFNESMKIELVYLSYKRVMIISPRDFIYIRIFFRDQSNKDNMVHWIVTFSVPYEKTADKTRAEVVFTAQKIEENTKTNRINIKVYSEVDMKTGAKAELTRNKGFSEIKKYVQKLYDYSKVI